MLPLEPPSFDMLPRVPFSAFVEVDSLRKTDLSQALREIPGCGPLPPSVPITSTCEVPAASGVVGLSMAARSDGTSATRRTNHASPGASKAASLLGTMMSTGNHAAGPPEKEARIHHQSNPNPSLCEELNVAKWLSEMSA